MLTAKNVIIKPDLVLRQAKNYQDLKLVANFSLQLFSTIICIINKFAFDFVPKVVWGICRY